MTSRQDMAEVWRSVWPGSSPLSGKPVRRSTCSGRTNLIEEHDEHSISGTQELAVG
jgi:hypothetical protein